jgi:long-chain acyl-CoA synthetase
MCAIMTPESFEYGSVGVPMPCAEVKLVDVPDAGYFANNKPSQGEIWLRGPSITKGYYNRDKETAEAFTEDGWFKTGDIGQWEPTGTVKIIDRKKNLVKTLNGEYIALEKVPSTSFDTFLTSVVGVPLSYLQSCFQYLGVRRSTKI